MQGRTAAGPRPDPRRTKPNPPSVGHNQQESRVVLSQERIGRWRMPGYARGYGGFWRSRLLLLRLELKTVSAKDFYYEPFRRVGQDWTFPTEGVA